MMEAVVKIGDVTEKVNKWDPRKEASEQLISYIDLSSVNKESKRIDDKKIEIVKGEDAPSRARQLVKQNDVLVSTVRPNLNGVAIVDKDYENATASTGYSVLRCNDDCFFKYLYYWTLTSNFVDDMVNKSSGASYPAVSDRIIKDSKIPLPPLPTQKKIAAILDAADAYRQKTKALIEKYDELTQSLFLDMFGDPVVNEKGWEIKTIGECFNVKGGKRLPKGTEYESKPTQYAYIRVTDFVKNGLEISDIKYINKDIHDKISRYVISSNDVYISIAGTIGLAGFVPEFLSGSNLTENAAKITSKENTKYRREYLSFYLNSDYAQQHIKSKTMAVGVPKLALFRIKELPYINAPEKVQSLFVKRVQKIEAQKAQAQESLEKAEELFNSLLGRAFKGELSI